MDSLLSVEQAAQRLGVSVWTVYRLARAGRLARVQLGRRRLFAERDLEALVCEARRCGAGASPEIRLADIRGEEDVMLQTDKHNCSGEGERGPGS